MKTLRLNALAAALYSMPVGTGPNGEPETVSPDHTPLSKDYEFGTANDEHDTFASDMRALEAEDAEQNQRRFTAPPVIEVRAASELMPMTRALVNNAVIDHLRAPNVGLSAEFRGFLQMCREMLQFALSEKKRVGGEAVALITVVQALAAENKVTARRLIQRVMSQVLWHASVLYQRALKGNEQEELDDNIDRRDNFRDPPAGLHADKLPYDENDVLEALTEANGWLGTIADLLPSNDSEREFLQLVDGLEYISKPYDIPETGERRWIQVHSATEALDLQLVKNQAAMRKRQQRDIAAKAGAFDALRRLVAAE